MTDTKGEANTYLGIKIPRFHKKDEENFLLGICLRGTCRKKGVWDAMEDSSDSSS